MKKALTVLLWVSGIVAGSTLATAANYVGSEMCFKCHAGEYNDFRVSGHPYKLSPAADAMKRALPLPPGYTWDDISYVIGGAYKKSRYVNKDGYIITAAKDGSELKTQYNLETGTWSFYHKGEKKPYDCGKCHTTGYDKTGHQDGKEGLIGTWAAPGVQCEACHGPGGDHVGNGDKTKIRVDTSAALCGQCHIRGGKEKVPAKGGFIRHHEQYNEILAGPHADLECVTCHNPHKKAQFSIIAACSSCHAEAAAAFKKSNHAQVGISCKECHMPRATKSAVKFATYEGDIRTHLFTINVDAVADMFYKEGQKTYAKGFVTLDFACLNCHKNKTGKWAAAKAPSVHQNGY